MDSGDGTAEETAETVTSEEANAEETNTEETAVETEIPEDDETASADEEE